MSGEDLARLRNFLDTVQGAGETRLPPEPKLSETLGISRGRLRTLLKRLEEQGLIWRHVGKGTFVGQRQLSPADQDWSGSISVDAVMDARMVLEPQLAASAAIHATAADILAMENCLVEMAEAASFPHWKRLDDRLHRVIAQASHNVLLLLMYDTLRGQIRKSLDARMEEVFGQEAGPMSATDQEHHEFVDAIRHHRPADAERLMREHLQSVRRGLFGLS